MGQELRSLNECIKCGFLRTKTKRVVNFFHNISEYVVIFCGRFLRFTLESKTKHKKSNALKLQKFGVSGSCENKIVVVFHEFSASRVFENSGHF